MCNQILRKHKVVVHIKSDVKAVGDVTLLPVENLVLGFSEVSHTDLHSSLSESDEA